MRLVRRAARLRGGFPPLGRSIRLLAVTASLLLHSGQTSEIPLSRSDPGAQELPSWVEQGNFRFIRLDGGRIESWKSERTWWGKEFSVDEKDVLSHIYDRDFDRMLDLLSEAHFNWIWVTWSNGWSVKVEEENRENLKRVIARCHEKGIRVSAYLSASNMFQESVYRDEPETKKYGLWMHGVPMYYAGPGIPNLRISWRRRLADTRKPGWRAYLLKKAALAVDAGVDAIVWDNMIGFKEGLQDLLEDTQRMAKQKAAEQGRPKVLVCANLHISPTRFGLNEFSDVIWEEDGKDTPGVWNGRWQVDNARKIKFLNGEKWLWQPLIYENDRYHCGPRERCIPTAPEQKLAIAEASTFGATTSRNIEGRFLASLIHGEPEATDAWAAIEEYNRFLDEHRDLYNQVAPAARIAVLSTGQRNSLADEFIRDSIFFETKVLTHLDKGLPLSDFKVLVLPYDIPPLDADQKSRFESFVAAGGLIIPARKSASDTLKRIEAAAGGPRLTLMPQNHVLGQLTRKADSRKLILHLLNYDQRSAKEDVRVLLNVTGLVKNLSHWRVAVLSPDEPRPRISGLSLHDSVAEFTLHRIQHYTVVILSADPEPK